VIIVKQKYSSVPKTSIRVTTEPSASITLRITLANVYSGFRATIALSTTTTAKTTCARWDETIILLLGTVIIFFFQYNNFTILCSRPQNGGLCVDGINDYTCKCVGEYAGKFCDISPSVALMYPQTSPCQHHECKNGICYQPNGSTNDYLCKCAPGYSGTCPRVFIVVCK